ncbi:MULTISPECIES: glycosyltransferase family 39 protein [unclassified Olleya]|uniref:glycosyltransferase family 39 protein n=1 Tax=unclassified Olleya TaxID=2615019 RepID=UPI00119E302D|nr:glycosyltransferase family 39 protein [Olleya sp. Hel_I_94]TVZ49707.1 dolichyl-phosphate-mannose-protein mannosyltransferase [Olleya sp. Hel_I_94]
MLKNIRYNNRLVYFLLAILYVAFAFPFTPAYIGLGYDQEIFQYIGMIIDHGLVPYKDVFDHKPPIIYFLNYLGFLITPNNTWGVFIILNILGLFSTILVYKIALKQNKKGVLSIVIASLYICLINSHVFLQGGNYTRQFTAYLTIVIMYLVFTKSISKISIVSLGVLLGLIFFTQQNEILGGSVLVAYYLMFKSDFRINTWQEILKNSLLFLLGLSVVFVIILVLIYNWENFSQFINQAYLFNFDNYIQQSSILVKVLKIIYAFGVKLVYLIPLLLASIVIIYGVSFSILKNKKLTIPLIIVSIAFVFQIISTSISGRTFGHYFLMFIPYIMLLIIYSINNIKDTVLKFLLVGLSLSIGGYLFNQIPYKKEETIFLADTLKIVESVKGENKQFYSFDASYLRVNFNLNINSPSKWIYTHYMDDMMLQDILKNLLSSKTRFVLVQNAYLQEFKNLDLFFTTHYNQVLSNNKHSLFQIK